MRITTPNGKFYALSMLVAGALCALAHAAEPQIPPAPAPAPVQARGPAQATPAPQATPRTLAARPRAVSARAINATQAQWVQQGPTQSIANSGNVNNIAASNGNPANPQIGAVNRLAVRGGTILAATPNGGIWRTTNNGGRWTAVSDDFPLSVYTVSFDFDDGNLAVAGFGRSSSDAFRGSSTLPGLINSTDNGATWQALGGVNLPQLNVSGVQSHSSTGVIIVTEKNTNFSNDGGIFRSLDSGATFQDLTNVPPLTTGSYMDLVSDPENAGTYYAAHRGFGQVTGQNGAVFRTTDDGANWTDITGGMAELGTNSDNIRLTVGPGGVVFVGIVNNGQLAAVYRATDARGGNPPAWVAMGVPTTTELGTVYGINPGKSGGFQFAIVADPGDNTLVYVGGDRQPAHNENGQQGAQFPNSLGAPSFSGRLFRGKFGPGDTLWQSITNLGDTTNGEGTPNNSSPHADTRDLVFSDSTHLLDACDGGIYERPSPQNNSADWRSLNGNLANTEFHSVAYDANSNIVLAGAQDNGASQQDQTGDATWPEVQSGDGGVVAIDDSVDGTSIRYACSQNWGFFRRRTFINGVLSATTALGLNVNGQSVFKFDPAAIQFFGPYTLNAINPTRVVFGTNRVFESLDQGDTLTDLTGDTSNPIAAMVYGGRSGGTDNPDLLLAGSGSALRMRTATNGNVDILTTYTGGAIRAIAVNPNDYLTIAVGDTSNRVFMSTDGGATPFIEITGDLPLTNLNALRFIFDSNGTLILLAGGQGGVYAAGNGEFNVWTQVGNNLPAQVQVDDIVYSSRTDTLAIATLGRGAYTLPLASTALAGAPVTFTAIQASQGPVAGGNTVTVKGSGFSGTPAVKFGGIPATNVTAVTASSFQCTVPASPGNLIGSVTVAVNVAGQTAERINAYHYINPPTVTGVQPPQGAAVGGTAVVITGTNFDSSAVVTFGGAPANAVKVNSSTQLTCLTPQGTVGSATVSVTVQGAAAAGNFTYLASAPPAPTITNITASTGAAAGGDTVTIDGTGFMPSATTVTFNGLYAQNVVVISPTRLTASTPGYPTPGPAHVVVSAAGANSADSTLFSYLGNGPGMASVAASIPEAADPFLSPNPDDDGHGVITITLTKPPPPGTSQTIAFALSGTARAGTDYLALGGNTVKIASPFQSADIQIVPIHRTAVAGAQSVTLTLNPGSGYLVGDQSSATVMIRDINQQRIGTVVPAAGSTLGGDVVKIQGANFAEGMKVFFGNSAARNVSVPVEGLIYATTPPGAIGPVDVTVEFNGITATLPDGFTYLPPPTLTQVSPASGTTAGGTAVTVTGTNFGTTTQVAFRGVPATNVTVLSSTQLTCTTPPGAAGSAAVAVSVNGVSTTRANAFTYVAPPVIAGLSPNTGDPKGGTTVVLFGANFQTGASVTFGGVPATNVVVNSANALTCTSPAGAGTVDVSVTVSDASGTLANAFTYVNSATGFLTIKTLAGRFNFAKQKSDTLTMTGELVTTAPPGTALEVSIGTFRQNVVLPTKALVLSKARNGTMPFRLTLKNQSLFLPLAGLGFSKTNTGPIVVPVVLRFGATGYQGSKLVRYDAKHGAFK